MISVVVIVPTVRCMDFDSQALTVTIPHQRNQGLRRAAPAR
jgi:hypothetical protein